MGKSILVTGGSGLVGNFLKKYIPDALYISSKDFDLTNEADVIRLLSSQKFDVVIHLAARVGGIFDNIQNQGLYFEENVLMNTLMLKWARLTGVDHFLGILSTCIYPDVNHRYPIQLEDLHMGPPAASNFSYGYAKRMLAVQTDAYNQQFGTRWNYLVPCNMFGNGDKEDELKSHFVTALLKKIRLAMQNGDDKIILFGDGTPIRQFIHADDFARCIAEVVENDIRESFNVASDETYTIDKIAKIAIDALSPGLRIEYDTEKPNGQYRKDVSVDEIMKIIPDFRFRTLREGIIESFTK